MLNSIDSLVAQTEAWFNDLKLKIINFDIKPAKPIIDDLLSQARLAADNYDFSLVVKILQKAIIMNKDNVDVLVSLSEAYLYLGNVSKSIYILKRAIKLSPNDPGLYKFLGEIYYLLGKYKISARTMQKALQFCPDEAQLKHIIDSRLGNTNPKAPEPYIVGLFDEYAEDFENHLLVNLEYSSPIKLVNYLHKQTKIPQPIEKALDLGCGTGLVGQALVSQFSVNKLVGIDLSPKMLEKCRAKNIYQELCNIELVAYLQQKAIDIDLIISADVLIYIGDLESVFAACYHCLKPGGYFCFSVERMFFGNYKLATSGRYKHSLSYIKSLYKKYHFSKMDHQAIDLRKESGNMVKGYLVLLQK